MRYFSIFNLLASRIRHSLSYFHNSCTPLNYVNIVSAKSPLQYISDNT